MTNTALPEAPTDNPTASSAPPTCSWSLVLLLLASLCQVGIGARFSESGEQIGTALPLSTLILGLTLVYFLARRLISTLPLLGPGQVVFLVMLSFGAFGVEQSSLPSLIKEWIQVGEILVLSVWLGQSLDERGRVFLQKAMGCVSLLVLILAVAGLAGRWPLKLSAYKQGLFVLAGIPFLLQWIGTDWRRGFSLLLLAVSALLGLVLPDGGMIVVALVVWGVAFRRAGLEQKWLLASTIGVLLVVSICRVTPWSAAGWRYDEQHLHRKSIEMLASLQAPGALPFGGGPGRYKETINQLKLLQGEVPHREETKVPQDSGNQFVVLLVESGLLAAVAFLVFGVGRAWVVRREAWPVALALGGLMGGGLFALVLTRGIGIWFGLLVGMSLPSPLSVPLARRGGRLLLVGLYMLLAGTVAFFWNQEKDLPPGQYRPSRMNCLGAFALVGSNPFVGRVTPSLPDPLAAADEKQLRIEAESALRIKRPFCVVPNRDASGGKTLLLPVTALKGIGTVEYQLKIPETGLYQLYGKVLWHDGCSNSLGFHFMDPAGTNLVLSSHLYGEWHVLKSPRPLRLAAGKVTLKVTNTETGVGLDYFGLDRLPEDP